MKRYWKVMLGTLLLIAGMAFFAIPWYNCVLWSVLLGVALILWGWMDRKKEKTGL